MLKKYFGLLIILLITFCSYLSANLICNYLKKRWDVLPEITLLAPPKKEQTEKNRNLVEYYKIIAKRNLFQIPPKDKDASRISEQEKETVAPLTDLKLKLLGTMVGSGITAYAIIKDLKTNMQDIYKVGDMAGPAELIKIYRNKVILLHEGAEEMLVAFEQPEPVEEITQVSESAYKPPGTSIRNLPQQLGQKIGQNHWVLNRGEVQEAINNSSQLLTQVRIIPHFNAGNLNQPDGFQVANIRSRSFFDRMGLKNGDIIRSVNGQPVNNPDKAFEAYQRLRNDPHIQVNVLRNNEEISLKYDIND